MADQGIKIVSKDGVFFLSGVLDEYADLTALEEAAEPLRLNFKGISRFNSIGIRGLLKFLFSWGSKGLIYEECPSEFVDQANMIPALLGAKKQGVILSLFVPYECTACDFDEEVLSRTSDLQKSLAAGAELTKNCPSCGGKMEVPAESFFHFLKR
jgi:hypothetical protein